MRDKRVMRAEEKADTLPEEDDPRHDDTDYAALADHPFGSVARRERDTLCGVDQERLGRENRRGTERLALLLTIDPEGTPVAGGEVRHRLLDAGEYELARKAYLRAAGTAGVQADILSDLGSAAMELGRLGQAEALLRAAIERGPRKPEPGAVQA